MYSSAGRVGTDTSLGLWPADIVYVVSLRPVRYSIFKKKKSVRTLEMTPEVFLCRQMPSHIHTIKVYSETINKINRAVALKLWRLG